MFLIVGLGNPGLKYAGNRHNVGFRVVDALADDVGPLTFREKFSGHVARAKLGGDDVVFLKPMTYMNLSGRSVQAAMRFFKVPLGRLICVHDELDLPFETIRIKVGGGTGGHNGLKSLVSECGGPEFIRVRMGIGRPPSGRVEGYVLSDFSKLENAILDDVLHKAIEIVRGVVSDGPTAAMNRFHAK